MAGMINNFQDNPRYERMIQKLSALRPDQKAIVDTAMLDEAFAGEAMKKHLASVSTAADIANRKKALDIQEKGMGLRTNLLRDRMDFDKGQQRWGTAISAANIPIAGYLGYEKMQADTEEARKNREFRDYIMSR